MNAIPMIILIGKGASEANPLDQILVSKLFTNSVATV